MIFYICASFFIPQRRYFLRLMPPDSNKTHLVQVLPRLFLLIRGLQLHPGLGRSQLKALRNLSSSPHTAEQAGSAGRTERRGRSIDGTVAFRWCLKLKRTFLLCSSLFISLWFPVLSMTFCRKRFIHVS